MFLHTLLITAAVILAYVTVWFVVSILAKRNDVADIAWGMGFVVASLTALIANHNTSMTAVVVCGLVFIWGLRLSLHIGLRNIKKPEDYRYKAKRDSWGTSFYVRSYFQIFLSQGLLLLVIALPVLLLCTYAVAGFNPLLLIGVLLWTIGFAFESIGDMQLKNFIANPANKGHLIQSGLWKYSRHPNYFGELTQWWAIGFIGLSCAYGWLGIIGPALLTYLIVKVSGIPLLEKKYAEKPEYQAYKKRTSILIPRTPL